MLLYLKCVKFCRSWCLILNHLSSVKPGFLLCHTNCVVLCSLSQMQKLMPIIWYVPIHKFINFIFNNTSKWCGLQALWLVCLVAFSLLQHTGYKCNIILLGSLQNSKQKQQNRNRQSLFFTQFMAFTSSANLILTIIPYLNIFRTKIYIMLGKQELM